MLAAKRTVDEVKVSFCEVVRRSRSQDAFVDEAEIHTKIYGISYNYALCCLGREKNRISMSDQHISTQPVYDNATAAARVRRATINERVFMSIPLSILDTLKWIMDVVREREGSLNGSEVDNGAMRNGMCRKFLSSGAALENWRRSLEGEV